MLSPRRTINRHPRRGSLSRSIGNLRSASNGPAGTLDKAIANATSAHKRNGKVHKVFLFGCYACDDWVDEPANGYQSDVDLLIVVSHESLTDIADYWYLTEAGIARDKPSNARSIFRSILSCIRSTR